MMPALRGLEALEAREERRLAGIVSGILYLTGSTTALLYLALPGAHPSAAWAVALCAAIGLAWGVACLIVVPWERGARGLSHASTAAGLPIIVVLVASTGGGSSTFRLLLFFVVVFAAYFYPPQEALAYFIGSILVLGAPVLYDSSAFAHGYAQLLGTFVPTLAVVGEILGPNVSSPS